MISHIVEDLSLTPCLISHVCVCLCMLYVQLHRLCHGSLSLGLPRDVALSAAYAGDTDTTRLGAGRVRTRKGILYVFMAICILESIYVCNAYQLG